MVARGPLARRALAGSPPGIHRFLNTDPSELEDPDPLIVALRGLRELRPHQPLSLEVHESTVADMDTFRPYWTPSASRI